MNINKTVLSIFAMVAVFSLGVAAQAHQNAASTIQDPRDAIQDAQNALNGVTFPTADNETRVAIAEGQEGLANVSSMLNSLDSANIGPSDQSTSPSGLSSNSFDQGTISFGQQ